ncbi:hypothetical protein DFJ77DRAFT_474397 [Powellomyces hirtus]|nr:hypothetical protein DFJ77DRAFT_474397 [Powellomyces hirtus]
MLRYATLRYTLSYTRLRYAAFVSVPSPPPRARPPKSPAGASIERRTESNEEGRSRAMLVVWGSRGGRAERVVVCGDGARVDSNEDAARVGLAQSGVAVTMPSPSGVGWGDGDVWWWVWVESCSALAAISVSSSNTRYASALCSRRARYSLTSLPTHHIRLNWAIPTATSAMSAYVTTRGHSVVDSGLRCSQSAMSRVRCVAIRIGVVSVRATMRRRRREWRWDQMERRGTVLVTTPTRPVEEAMTTSESMPKLTHLSQIQSCMSDVAQSFLVIRFLTISDIAQTIINPAKRHNPNRSGMQPQHLRTLRGRCGREEDGALRFLTRRPMVVGGGGRG